MRPRVKIANGIINESGQLNMYMEELRAFFAENKGKKVIARFEVVEPTANGPMVAYYYKYVVPTVKDAMWNLGQRMTEEDTEEFLREQSPIMIEQEVGPNGKYLSRLRTVDELSNAEFVEHLDTIKQLAAEELGVFIEDPRKI